MKFWRAENTLIGWRFGMIVPLFITLLFFNYAMPIGVLIAGQSIVFLFFLGLNYFSKQWVNSSYVSLEARIFYISLILRVIFVGYQYLLTYWLSPASFPFEISAADSWVYHNVALELMESSFGDWFEIIETRMKSRSDFGFPIYQGLLYSLFGPYTFVVRFFNAIFGSLTVVMLGRIVNISWGDAHAKMTAIIAMLFPTLIWFCGIQLKETIMVFVLVSAFYMIWKMRSKLKWSVTDILLVLLLCFILFFFRTFLAVLVFISVLLIIFTYKSKSINSWGLFSIMISLYLFYSIVASTDIFKDVNSQIEDSSDFFSRNLESEKNFLGNVTFDQVALAPVIIAASVITPFPSYLNTEARQLSIYTRFQNDLVRNMMYFFMYAGLYFTFKKRFKEYTGILFFLMAYLGVITAAANSFQARFHMPIIPFVIVFMGIGIVELNPRFNRMWLVYLMLIFIAQLAWTYFKLDIRGIDG